MFITKKKLKELIEKERREWEQAKRNEDENSRIWRRLDEMSSMFWEHDRVLRDMAKQAGYIPKESTGTIKCQNSL